MWIIFDGNYLLMKAVFALHKANQMYGNLGQLLTNNIDKYVALNKWDKIIIVSDSRKKSWRKEYLNKYKENRVKQEDIDWEYVFTTYAEWKEEIAQKYLVFEGDNIEGDDWIAFTSQYGNKHGHNTVVISSDQDMYQLVNFKVNDKRTTIHIQIADTMGSELVVLPEGWEIWRDAFGKNTGNDVFKLDNSVAHAQFFDRIVANWQNVEVNPHQRLFEKIVMGDKGDNIDSVYQTLTKTSKIVGIGKAGARKIWEFYHDNVSTHYTTNEEFFDDVVMCLERVKNITLPDGVRRTVRDNIKLNSKLIELKWTNYPDWVMNEIAEKIEDHL